MECLNKYSLCIYIVKEIVDALVPVEGIIIQTRRAEMSAGLSGFYFH